MIYGSVTIISLSMNYIYVSSSSSQDSSQYLTKKDEPKTEEGTNNEIVHDFKQMFEYCDLSTPEFNAKIDYITSQVPTYFAKLEKS